MGDLRNKARSESEKDRVIERMRAQAKAHPYPEPPSCDGCGVSCLEAEVYALPRDWKGPYNFACAGCMSLAGYGEWHERRNRKP